MMHPPMTVPDYTAIMADAMTSAEFSGHTVYSPPRAASYALAARVPELCQTCKGDGKAAGSIHTRHGDCPDCPTIAKLLAIGAAVMGAELERCEWVALETDGDLTRIAGTLLNRLRAVQP